MFIHLKTLYTHRELLWMWTVRDIKVRYKQSLLGGAWAVLQPLSLMIMFSVIFTYFVKIPTEGIPYPIFSYTALLPWTFFSTSISLAVPSLVNNMHLVTKSYFPREILPVSSVLASLVDFTVGAVVFAVMAVIYRVRLSSTMVVIPLIVLIQTVFTLAVVLFASAVNVFYRDIRFVVPLAIQLWMYATPIIYPVTLVPERFRAIYMLNPTAVLIESYRAAALRGMWPSWSYLAIAAGVSVVAFLASYAFFKRVEWQFADII